MRQAKKSDLVACLESTSPQEVRDSPQTDVRVIDGAASVHFLQSMSQERSENMREVFITYIDPELARSKRVDIVWDTYKTESLKATARENRGTGARRRVSSSAKMPGNRKNFLHF